MTGNEEIKKFAELSDNFIQSKYILIDRNISLLLHSAVESSEIYNLIAKSMINFDFVSEWKIATENGNSIIYPEDKLKKIAFIFCMLNNIDDRKLDITKVFEHYFGHDKNLMPYDLFCKTVIVEFKELVLTELGVDLSEDVSEKEGLTPEEIKEKENEMLTLIFKLKDEIRKHKKVKGTKVSKSDIIAVVSTLEYAVKSNDMEYFYALTISIKILTEKVRKLKNIVLKIEEISNSLIRS